MEENVSILKVDTGEAVKSVNDLRENIKLLKGNLGELTIGSQAYQDTLEELTINQNALKNAMHATSASLDEVVAAAASANVQFDEQNKLIDKSKISYNELVNTMAALKEEWRSTTDESQRAKLGEKIAEINNQLKGMDASVGNFSRNVGNYESGVTGLVAKFDTWGATLKQLPPTLGAAKDSLGKVGETMQLVGKQPILGIVGLLAPLIMKITESLKNNETAMDAVKRLMASFQPVFDVIQAVIEGIAQGVANVIDWFIQLIGQSDGLKKVMSSVTGVGNAILQYLLTPIRTVVAAFQGLGKIVKDVFTGDFASIKTHAKEAGEGIASAWQEGFSFKDNFEEGKTFGADFVKGVKANTEEAKEAGKEIAKAVNDGFNEWEDEQRALAEEEAFYEEYQAQIDATEAFQKEQQERLEQSLIDRLAAKEEAAQREIDLDKAVEDANQAYINEQKEGYRAAMKERIATMGEVAAATSNLLSSLADMYESDEKNAEKNAKKIKNLRIASATIDMLNGAVTAFTSAMQLGPVAGPIVGGINAAAVIAMGIANINKIKSTDPSGGGAPSAPASVSPPSVDTGMQSVRNVTSASEEERLNRMASPQRVYILQSDIEAAGSQSKAQVEESSF